MHENARHLCAYDETQEHTLSHSLSLSLSLSHTHTHTHTKVESNR